MKFIKNSISSWTFATGAKDTYGDQIPDGTTFSCSTIIWTVTAARFGTYQALSTRSNGEIIDASSN